MSLRTYSSMLVHRYLRIPYTLNTHVFRSPKKPKATYILIHGIGNTLKSWEEVVDAMPNDVRIIGIDLLGFGDSPRPEWAVYSARTQARSVGATLLGMKLTQRPIIVGHSLGALVAVAVARRYPFLLKGLVLCSPPFYKPFQGEKRIPSADDMLRKIYTIAKRHPEQLEYFSPLAVRLGLANKALNITSDNVSSYMAALESSVINQTALEDVVQLKLPIDIFYGRFDPVVIRRHITNLAKQQSNITAIGLNAGHEVKGGYARAVAAFLTLTK